MLKLSILDLFVLPIDILPSVLPFKYLPDTDPANGEIF
jgi:hypothetical protein